MVKRKLFPHWNETNSLLSRVKITRSDHFKFPWKNISTQGKPNRNAVKDASRGFRFFSTLLQCGGNLIPIHCFHTNKKTENRRSHVERAALYLPISLGPAWIFFRAKVLENLEMRIGRWRKHFRNAGSSFRSLSHISLDRRPPQTCASKSVSSIGKTREGEEGGTGFPSNEPLDGKSDVRA